MEATVGAVELLGHQVHYGPENVATVCVHLELFFVILVGGIGLIIRLHLIFLIHFGDNGHKVDMCIQLDVAPQPESWMLSIETVFYVRGTLVS